jgi:hypothetical protein
LKRPRRDLGTTIVEVSIGAALLVVVVGAAAAMATTSSGVAQSTADTTAAAMRADRALAILGEALQIGSLATLKKSDGTAFADGASGTGFQIQKVSGYTNAAVLDASATYHFDITAGALSGSLIQTQNGIDRVIVTGVTSFTVTRAGTLFTLNISTRSGANDDRARTTTATLQVASRNS